MKKKSIKIFQIICIAIYSLLVAVATIGYNPIETTAYALETQKSKWETKRYWSGDETENFEDNSVIVVMDKSLSEVNKKHKKSFFGDFGQVFIEDLTYLNNDPDDLKYLNKENFRQILKITLPQRSKDNVIKVIKKI